MSIATLAPSAPPVSMRQLVSPDGAANFGSTSATWQTGDFTLDSIVNLNDFNILAANFGLSAGPNGPTPEEWSALAAVVPEPAPFAFTVVASAAIFRPRVRCRTR